MLVSIVNVFSYAVACHRTIYYYIYYSIDITRGPEILSSPQLLIISQLSNLSTGICWFVPRVCVGSPLMTLSAYSAYI